MPISGSARAATLRSAAAIGAYDGFFGPGTGSFFTATLVGVADGLTRATALTKLFNLTSNVASVLFFAIGGKMFWLLGLCMAAGPCSAAGSAATPRCASALA